MLKIVSDNLKHIVENNGQKKNPKAIEKDIRYLFAAESLKLIKQKPIFGYGTGSFSSVFKENVLSNYRSCLLMHTLIMNAGGFVALVG